MDDDENVLCRFGTALDPLEEDEVPSKKPIAIEDQIVTDSNGRRRFHGAFTGGFSAGFWNTVGSLEGWKPQSFKSSRLEKAEAKTQQASDFMDEEDLGEFGFAPQRIQTTDDFTPQDINEKRENRKRKKYQSTGPIPGVPVLHQLLKPSRDNVAVRLLKQMGWKLGQGIGARQTRREKKTARDRNARERYVLKKYGCDLGPMQPEHVPEKSASESDDESDLSDNEITFAPDDFEQYICDIKDNTFGLGYVGLNKNPILKQQHINLFGTFEVMGKDNKKLSIRGQAFGVGALEEEDEDIYANDDMTKYDFSLDEAKKIKIKKKKVEDATIIEGFCAAKEEGNYRKKIFTVQIPADFKPRNWAVRKTRFEPLNESKAAALKEQDTYKRKGLGRHDLDPERRGAILESTKSKNDAAKPNEKNSKSHKNYGDKTKTENVLNLLVNKLDRFAKGGLIKVDTTEVIELDEDIKKENDQVQEEAKKLTNSLDKKEVSFKPFISNEAKQERYEKFIAADLTEDDEISKFLATIQPLGMSDWDREMEKKEFLQAQKIYKPLRGQMFERFVSEAALAVEKPVTEKKPEVKEKIEIKRTKVMWKPCAQLCKRFDVPEPFGGTMIDTKVKKKPRFSVFDYLETSINTKQNFVTPVIIPTKVEKPKPIIQQIFDSKEVPASSRISTRELFMKEMNLNPGPSAMKDGIESADGEHNKKTPVSTSAQSSSELDKKSKKTKTDLEIKVEELKDKHPSEKKDLFKSIFDSSSEEEDEIENGKEGNSNQQSSQPTISQDVINALTKPAADVNVLRNTSPPRGIFAYLFKSQSERSEKSAIADDQQNQEESSSRAEELSKDVTKDSDSTENNVYGPMIPTSLTAVLPKMLKTNTCSSSNEDVDKKLLKLLKKSKKDVVEKWVEKSDENTDKKKKKKDKDKKKKSKKHKKEKKKDKK